MTNNYGIQMISRIQERRQVEPTHAVIIMCTIIIILVYGMIISTCVVDLKVTKIFTAAKSRLFTTY